MDHLAIVELAKDLVALWENPRIQGLPRSDRNASIEDTRKLMIEAVKALDNGGWLPIETAPQDGRAIFLLSRPYSHEAEGIKIDYPARCNIGKWNAEGTSWVDEFGQLSDESYHHLATTGIWESGGGWFQPNEVSHWMPLPAPPPMTMATLKSHENV